MADSLQQPPLPAHGNCRVLIERVEPSIDAGEFPVKIVVGDRVTVTAHIFADGHDRLVARLRHRPLGSETWQESCLEELPNDEWTGEFYPEGIGFHEFNIIAWVDPFFSWQHGFQKKIADGQPLGVEVKIGREILQACQERTAGEGGNSLSRVIALLRDDQVPLGEKVHLLTSRDTLALALRFADLARATTLPRSLEILVERKRAAFSAWYEFFPRSFGLEGAHGTFDDARRILPRIASMGFNVVYLPPIHPIGEKFRKGRNNTLQAEASDVGSPWAIGSGEGGHKSIHPALGDGESFRHFLNKAGEHGLEVALDIALQCSPDHPYIREHPEWFKWRPDGTIQYAENPPKKYQDIVPFDFECSQWRELWEELKSIFMHWIGQGVKIFRVDNPHTKPLEFWRWLIRGIKIDYPEVIFLSEAFTRPKLKYRLAKTGFTQGYTYFTWRNTKPELESYLRELCGDPVRRFFWPNFWPNTPDILPEMLQYGGRAAFAQRVILAATLSSNFGLYGPAYELCVHEPYPGKEEYNFSEKYEIKSWDWDRPGNIRPLIRRLNQIRRDQPALHQTFNLRFLETDNPQIIAYLKHTESYLNIILVVVNLDPYYTQSGWVNLPLEDLGIDPDKPFLAQDLLPETGEHNMPAANYLWSGRRNFVKLDPAAAPAHIFRIFRRQKHEEDFDYWL